MYTNKHIHKFISWAWYTCEPRTNTCSHDKLLYVIFFFHIFLFILYFLDTAVAAVLLLDISLCAVVVVIFFFIFFSSACYFATRNSVFMCYVRTHIRNAIAIRIAVPKIAQSINIIRIHSEDVEKNSKTLWGRSLHQRINFMLPTRYCVSNKILYRAISNIKLRYFFTMPNHCSEFRYLMVANAP